MNFLIDTGSSVSIIPYCVCNSLCSTLSQTSLKLKAADNHEIKIHGETQLELKNKSLRRSFSWVFIVAEVARPILGADFLSHYGINVDCSSSVIFDPCTKFAASCNCTSVSHCSFQVKYPDNCPDFVMNLLKVYSKLVSPSQIDYSDNNGPSQVCHTIDTGSAPPVFARARPLHPAK